MDQFCPTVAIILASQSPARKAMLEAAGVAFKSVPAHIDETAVIAALQGQPVKDVADRLAELKAVKISYAHPDAVVVGADSLLETANGDWLEKPGTPEGLVQQLRLLRGQPHQIVSAAVAARNGQVLWRHCAVATLQVRAFSEAWLAAYVASAGADVLGSVGGYHVESSGVQLFETIRGDLFTVRGLPLLPLLAWLRNIGAMPQ